MTGPAGLLESILTAPVYEVAIETPLERAPRLSLRLGNEVLLKREDLQPIFSFKLRGAYTKISRLPRAALVRGVIAASAGNHAQGVALAALHLGCNATIVMPATAPAIKMRTVEALGAELVVFGSCFSESEAHAHSLARVRRLTLVHPFDDLDVIAGQGTIGIELLRQRPSSVHAIFVPVGGGGLIAGIASYVKRLQPRIRVIGVEPVDSDALARSMKAGRRIRLPRVGPFADGVAVAQIGALPFAICRALVDEVVRVDDDAICAAIRDVFEDTRSILEPAGALALAGLKTYAVREGLAGRTLVAIASGANIDFKQLGDVAQRAEASGGC